MKTKAAFVQGIRSSSAPTRKASNLARRNVAKGWACPLRRHGRPRWPVGASVPFVVFGTLVGCSTPFHTCAQGAKHLTVAVLKVHLPAHSACGV